MKDYIKNEIKHIPMILVVSIMFYGIATYAIAPLFNSNEVSYDNTVSGIKQDNVQGAIDELYACTSNYSAYDTRLTNTETAIGTGSLTTTSQSLIGGVNELKTNIGTVPSGKTTQGQIDDLKDTITNLIPITFTINSNSTDKFSVTDNKSYEKNGVVYISLRLKVLKELTAGTEFPIGQCSGGNTYTTIGVPVFKTGDSKQYGHCQITTGCRVFFNMTEQIPVNTLLSISATMLRS